MMAHSRAIFLTWVFVVAILLASVEDIEAKRSFGGSRKSGSSSGWFGSSSSSKSKPQTQTHTHSTGTGTGTGTGTSGTGSSGSYGWNTGSNNAKTGTNGYAGSAQKPSAPSPDYATKTHATNVQSGYPGASGGYGNPPPYSQSGGYKPGNPPGYNTQPGGYHGNPPPYSQSGGYHAPPPYGSSGGYHGGAGGYNGGYGNSPNYGSHGFSGNPGAGYNPSYGHSSMSQPSTVVMQSSRPGIGQLAKEAFVFAGVSAGVNAAVNRIIPGGIYGNSYGHGSPSSSGVVPPVSHTQITYNYYNNGTNPDGSPAPVQPAAAPGAAPAAAAAAAAPAVPAAAPAEAAPAQADKDQPPNPVIQDPFGISDADIQKLTEDLFSKETNNAFKHISMNLQGQKSDDSTTDDAPENLLDVKPEAYEIPTVKAVLALHDNYELDVKNKEDVTSEERKEETDLLDAFMNTEVMKTTMKYLADKGFVANDEYEFKDTLKRIWFSQFKRIDGDASSSGFETVFLAEKFDNEIIGLHNWIYFAKQEEAKKLDYLGYIKKLDLGSTPRKGAVVKGRSKLIDTVQPITTIFVGTSPELEMALYTICFFTRPNIVCPVSLGGANVLIIANRVNYFGKDILISAFPDV